MNKRDIVGALFFLCVGLVGLAGVHAVSFGSIHQPGSAFFPIILSLLLILLALGLLWQAMRAKIKQGLPNLGEYAKLIIPGVAGLIAYSCFVEYLGYVVCTFLIILIFSVIARSTWKGALLLAAICTLSSYALLKWYLYAPLPQGILPF